MSRRWSYILSCAGALYSGFIVVWFFVFFARGTNQPFSLFGSTILFYLILVLSPFVVIALAQYIQPSTRSPRAIVFTTFLLFVCSGFFYAPGLRPYQDGEFAAAFYLAIPQLLLAIACLIYASISRRKVI